MNGHKALKIVCKTTEASIIMLILTQSADDRGHVFELGDDVFRAIIPATFHIMDDATC